MASIARQRERYRTDPAYRLTKLEAANQRKRDLAMQRERARRLRGWSDISTVPENETVLLYDPTIFWPVVATWDGTDWDCAHYEGRVRPTHWRFPIPVPLP